MTRIAQCGWELGDVGQIGATSQGGSAGALPTVVATTPTPRSGGYCLKCSYTNTSANGFTTSASRLTVAHATLTEVWYAFGFYYTHTNEPATPCWAFAHANDAGGLVNVILAVDSGTVRAYAVTAGGSNPSTANVTLIGTASASLTSGAWHLIEVRLIASTGAGGTCTVYQDGAQVINATGVRTAQTTASYAALGLCATCWAPATSQTPLHAYDDLRINSTAGSLNNGRPGDESIRLLVPTAAGDLTQLSRGGTDSGANWSQVDEVPAASADYVTGATVGLTDLYQTTDFPVSAISAINVIAQISNSDGGGGTVYLPVKTDAGQSDGAALVLTTSWTLQNRLLEADPADAAAWSSAKLAALQIGCKVAS